MACDHKRIKSENCVISCMDCGEILPLDYIVGKETQEEPIKKTTRRKAK